LLLNAHYRQPMDWSEGALTQIRSTLDRLYGALREAPAELFAADPGDAPEELLAALCEDLNTPQALALLSQYGHEVHRAEGPAARLAAQRRLLAAGRLLGLLRQTPQAWFQGAAGDIDSARIEGLLAERQAAKASRNFARADAIRQELAAEGIQIEDTPAGPRWRLDGKSGS
jgi:cysteinyl-tRNA synthetase